MFKTKNIHKDVRKHENLLDMIVFVLILSKKSLQKKIYRSVSLIEKKGGLFLGEGLFQGTIR